MIDEDNKTFYTPTRIIEINGHQAIIKYDEDIDMFRGEFIDLKMHTDFYAKDLTSLFIEGMQSLKSYFEMYNELV